ncbi:uncharacterized protein JCM15063_002256 [Sporobolomyces koalae]|uniref:uncharacterized protein n=1 Tax=Sporobolomyces koalae TaxID=500713 RepID=UPI003170C6ED
MTTVLGDWYKAQQVFNSDNFACSAGQTIAEYCAKVQDTCCAVCPNAPITGPGTLIVMTLGTFVNLLFCLWYQSEAPYNLTYQLVATDGAAFGLLNRLIQDDFRLSEIHYAFIPLAIMSCIPLAVTACLADAPSLRSQGPSAQAGAVFSLVASRRAESTDHVHSTQSFDNEQDADVRAMLKEVDLPRSWLIRTAWAIFTAHLVAWPILFVFVYLLNDRYNQPHCADVFPLRRYRIILGSLVASWLFFALIIWIIFTRVLFSKKMDKKDTLESIGEMLMFLTHSKSENRHRVHPAFDAQSTTKLPLFPKPFQQNDFLKSRARPHSILRWSISIGIFLIWAAEYMAIWLSAVHGFVLIGTNGFDFGQVAAVVGIGIPTFLIVRAQLDYTDNWKAKRETWEAAHKAYHHDPRSSPSSEEPPFSRGYRGHFHTPLARMSSTHAEPSSSRDNPPSPTRTSSSHSARLSLPSVFYRELDYHLDPDNKQEKPRRSSSVRRSTQVRE